uniref:G-protein coupled receptors family 1 profile domain-containing protein n=1 Tax=Lepisosteus oculatus TaxID=7918 RepID=W5LX09_LEPOC
QFIVFLFSSLKLEHYTKLFIIFLILFLVTFFSNFFILMLVILDNPAPHLLPSFPSCYQFFSGYDNTISLPSCFAQMYFYISLGAVEIFLVAAMAYVAVVKPHHYNIIINPKICIKMAAIAWMFGFLAPFLSVVFASSLKFCGSNRISHIVCDYPTVKSLACGDDYDYDYENYCHDCNIQYIPFIFVLCSYCRIVWAVTKMKTIESRKKAFSMCSSHVTVVFLYYVSAAMVFIGLRAEGIPHNVCIFFRAMCNCLTPLVNP